MCLQGRRGRSTLELSSCDCCTRSGMSALPRALPEELRQLVVAGGGRAISFSV